MNIGTTEDPWFSINTKETVITDRRKKLLLSAHRKKCSQTIINTLT